jgi:hypothetical protein
MTRVAIAVGRGFLPTSQYSLTLMRFVLALLAVMALLLSPVTGKAADIRAAQSSAIAAGRLPDPKLAFGVEGDAAGHRQSAAVCVDQTGPDHRCADGDR